MSSMTLPTHPPQLMSVTDRLNAGMAQQEAISAKKKKKKDRKRKREFGGDALNASVVQAEGESQVQSNQPVNGDIVGGDTKPIRKSKKKHKNNRSKRNGLDGYCGEDSSLVRGEDHGSDGGIVRVDDGIGGVSPKAKKHKTGKEVAASDTLGNGGDLSLAAAEMDTEAVGDNEDKGKSVKKKRKLEEKTARKSSEKATLEEPGQEVHDNLRALLESPLMAMLKSQVAPQSSTPGAKAKSDLLLQTILKGCKHEEMGFLKSTEGNEAGQKAAQTTSKDNSNNIQAANGTEVIATKELKPKKKRDRHPKKANSQTENTTNQAQKPGETQPQTIEAIKTSSTSTIKEVSSKLPITPPSRKEFFNNEPLVEKRERILAASSQFSSEPYTAAAVAPALKDPPAATAASLKEWGTTSGKIRGIVGVNTDEEPEENLAFSFEYISNRPKGVNVRDVNFNIISLECGKERIFDSEEGVGLRICSVAAGKVDVTLGRVEFGIGRGSMWRVKAGESCVVRNEGKKMAILHVTSMP